MAAGRDGQGVSARFVEAYWTFDVGVGALAQGGDLPYISGVALIASLNGYLMPARVWTGAADASADLVTTALQSAVVNSAGVSTTIAVLRMPADSTQPEIVFDQRI